MLEPRLDGWLLSAEWNGAPPPGPPPGPPPPPPPPESEPLPELGAGWCAAGVCIELATDGGETGVATDGVARFIIMSVWLAALLPWPCVSKICESSSCNSAYNCNFFLINKKLLNNTPPCSSFNEQLA